ncbi:response regulator transcription factor [Mangrovibacterium diazotrophicum]|uniref:LuxR family two component transcriptional regulator n=1 Tax=Mangrovibacterium diazotrophicum TaxID=1261403 RepID=A0A419VUT0_9BACT|nr:response regulator transcription factor [Mangrovibacterium diazotrophicum]RKD85947.1 LuxR family two component transcriptional regulator [Mangrovibacterium diazotrophicum]
MNKEIVIAGDNHILRKGLGMLFENDGRFRVVGEVSKPAEFFSEFKRNVPEIVLLDLTLLQDDVFSILNFLRGGHPDIPVVALAIGASEGAVLDAVMMGVRAVIWKEDSWENLLEAMSRVLNGEIYFEMSERRLEKKLLEGLQKANNAGKELLDLSPREQQVLKLIAEGLSYKQIADILSISPRTVESHKNNLLEKLNLSTPVDLVKYAMRMKLVD